ncbi:CU044_2847 family protein [Nonomuraea sp. NPDC050556]|uniref:CU044_2847 family protein n=1 Tax=Nonomuraea sp. NPDC050556 TaxID=3364369 RepID=UPI0037B08E59
MDNELLVPLDAGGRRIYLSVTELNPVDGEEKEIGARVPTLEQALDGLANLAQVMGERLRETDASKVTVEFGCEFALESGSFVAVIGKASGKSTFKVGLEWAPKP